MSESFAGGLVGFFIEVGDPLALSMNPVARQEWADFCQLARDLTNGAGVVPVAQENMPVALPVMARGTYQDFVSMQVARNGDGPMSVNEVMAQFAVPKRTAYHWLAKARNDTLTIVSVTDETQTA